MKTNIPLLRAVAACLVLASAHVSAQTTVATFRDNDPGLNTSGTFVGGSFQTYSTGLMNFDEFQAFCVDPFQTLEAGKTVIYQVQDLSTLAGAGTIAKLVGGYLASAQTALDAAAVQWAIWEVVVDGTSYASLNYGKVKLNNNGISGTVRNLANQYLSNVDSFDAVSLTYLTNPHKQDIVVIPEPGTAALGALSMLLLFRRRRG